MPRIGSTTPFDHASHRTLVLTSYLWPDRDTCASTPKTASNRDAGGVCALTAQDVLGWSHPKHETDSGDHEEDSLSIDDPAISPPEAILSDTVPSGSTQCVETEVATPYKQFYI